MERFVYLYGRRTIVTSFRNYLAVTYGPAWQRRVWVFQRLQVGQRRQAVVALSADSGRRFKRARCLFEIHQDGGGCSLQKGMSLLLTKWGYP